MHIIHLAQLPTFYHGTASAWWPQIQREGLQEPFLCDSLEKAHYYAVETDEHPMVLRVTAPDANLLRYDAAAMDEPVLALPEDRDRAWEEAAQQHPEWMQDGMIIVPPEAWAVSWKGVGSCWYEGIISASNFQRIE